MPTIKDYIEDKASSFSIKDYMEKAILGALEDREDILIPKDFAYTPDVEKPSTWRLRIDVPEAVLQSIIEFREMLSAQVIPEDRVEGIKQRLRTAYETFFPEREVPELIQATDPLEQAIEGLDVGEVSQDSSKLLDILQQLLTAFGPTQRTIVDVKKSLDEELRQALFVVLEPEVYDLHNHIYSEEAVAEGCHNFNQLCNRAYLLHQYETDGAEIVESYIAPVAFSLDGKDVKKGTWLQLWQIHDDDIWDKVKSGEYNGVSIGCTGMLVDEV